MRRRSFLADLRVVLALAAALVSFPNCTGRVAGGGDATETGNALAGTLVLEDGSAAVGARVALVPEGHHPVRDPEPPDSLRAVADAKGRYGFARVAPGRYNVVAYHPATGRRAFIQDVRVGSERVDVAKAAVRAPGSLALALPDWLPAEGGNLYVPGSTYRAQVEGAPRDGKRVVFDSLPAGGLAEVRYVQEGADTASLRLSPAVTVRPGAREAVHPFAAWAGRARVVLNTAAAGTALEKDLPGFPILVRLAAPVFDPASARPDGADLRFARPDGASLPFEMATWGADGASAWVRLDTLHAGDAGQHLTVHWGNPDAAAPRQAAPVFDTAAGFAGVWHLDEAAADTAADDLYRDATAAGNHGDDRVAAAGKPGVVGAGQSFALGDYIRTSPASAALRPSAGFTLATWFRARPQGRQGEILSVGDNFGLRLSTKGQLQVFFWPVTPPPAGQVPWYNLESAGADFLDGEWHLAQGTYDGQALRLYLDGRELGALVVPGTVAHQFPSALTLGRHGNGQTGFDYVGDLDEAQVHSRARGLDWHRMSYENQRPGSGFPAVVAP